MSINNFRLADMTADDFETARAAGYSYRREMTHAVMASLKIPDNWDINGEYGSEFGGLFPVQIRLSPTHGLFQMVLCSPGEISDHWLLLMVSGKGRNVVCVRHRDGYTPADIIVYLTQEVTA